MGLQTNTYTPRSDRIGCTLLLMGKLSTESSQASSAIYLNSGCLDVTTCARNGWFCPRTDGGAGLNLGRTISVSITGASTKTSNSVPVRTHDWLVMGYPSRHRHPNHGASHRSSPIRNRIGESHKTRGTARIEPPEDANHEGRTRCEPVFATRHKHRGRTHGYELQCPATKQPHAGD